MDREVRGVSLFFGASLVFAAGNGPSGARCSLLRVLAKALTPCRVCDEVRAMGDAIRLPLEV